MSIIDHFSNTDLFSTIYRCVYFFLSKHEYNNFDDVQKRMKGVPKAALKYIENLNVLCRSI